MGLQTTLLLLAAAAGLALAHPHGQEKPTAQHAAQPLYMRSLSHCDAAGRAADPEAASRLVARREVEVARLRRERGLHAHAEKRDYRTVLDMDHRANGTFSPSSKASDLFANTGSCILTPEVTEGPLYVQGEQIRRQVTEGESGVKMTIDIQVVDIKTCMPIENAVVDFWSCNSTGVYGGVLYYPGNGDPNDMRIINTTTLRGLQFTDKDGIAAFDTVVPGHYVGRANHVHAVVHMGATRQPNGTVTGGTIAHVGQMYFDQSLLQSVEKLPPYTSNTQSWMQNGADFLFMQGADGDDPVVRYTLLGDSLADGIFAWIRFGVDAGASRPLLPAAFYDEHGGHQNPNGPVSQGLPGFPIGGGGFPGAPPMPGAGKTTRREAEDLDAEE